MATLEQLNFEIILNDKAFSDSIDAVVAKAKDMNTEVSAVLDGLNKVASGKTLSQSKKNELLFGLRNEIKSVEAELASLQRNYDKMWTSFARNGADEIMFPKTAKNLKEQSNRIDELKAKLAQLNEAYKKLGGDKALANSFKETKKNASDTNIELLQMREYYKQMATGANSTATAQKRLTDETRKGSTALGGMSKMWRDIKNYTMMYFSFAGATRLISNLVRVSAEFEKQRVSLHAILQDADGAERIFNQIKELAVMSPFTFKELVTYTKQLSAFSIPMEELYDTTKMLADVSAGLGVGMDRLVLAYGQIRSASFLRGQEVRQLTEAGIPILRELSEMFTELEGKFVSAGEVFDKISKRQVTFEMVEQVFRKMTDEGGKFYQMQEVLAETLSGKLSNLTDAYQIMFAEIGEKSSGVLYGTVDALRRLAENYEEVGKTLARLVATYGAYKLAVTASTIWNNAMFLATINGVKTYKELGAALKIATTETKAFQAVNAAIAKINPYAALAAGVAALVMWIVKMKNYTSEYAKAQQAVNDNITEYKSKSDGEIANLKFLINQMRGLNKESDEYKNLKKQIIGQYGQYMDDIDRENLAVKNLTAVYDKLTVSIKKMSYEKMMSAGREKIADYYKDTVNSIWQELNEAMINAKIDPNSSVGAELRGKVIGTVKELSEEATEAARKINNRAMNKNAINGIWRGFLNLTTPYSLFEHDDWKKHGLDQLTDMYNKANIERDKLTKDLEAEGSWFEKAMGADDEGTTKKMTQWQQALSDMAEEASQAGIKLGITVDEMSDFIEMSDSIDKAVDKSADALERYRKAGEKELAKEEENRLKYLQRMQARLGGSGKGATKSAITAAEKKELEPIQEQIRVYQRLKSVYESLVETLGDTGARQVMESYFPQYGEMVNADFDSKIQGLADDMLELAMGNEQAAKAWLQLKDAMSDENVSTFKKSADAAKKYREEIEKWIEQGYLLSGTGFSYDISKNLLDITTKDATTSRTFEALRSAIDEQEEAYKASIEGTEEEREKMWQQFKIEQIHILDELARHEMANNHKAVQEKIRDLAQTYVREMYATNADGKIELNDWGDKSMAQIEMIGRSLRTLMNSDLDIPDKIKKDAEDLGVTFDELMEAIREIFTADYSNVLQERMKRMSSILGNVLSLANKITNSVGSMADHIEDGPLKDFTEMLGVVLDVADAVVECEPLLRAFAEAGDGAADAWKNLLNSADLMTMVVKILGIGVEQIVRNVEKQYDKQKEIAEAAKEYKKTLDEIALAKYDGVLGVDDMGKLAQYYNQMADASTKWANTVDKLKTLPSLTAFMVSSLEQAGYDLKNLDVNQLKELSATVKQLAVQADDAYALLLAEQIDDYIEKLEGYESAISDIFSNVADDIVDNLVSAFDELGDSVADIEGAFYDLGDTILRSVLRSMVLENIVEKYKNDFMKAVTEYSLTDQTANDATALAAQLGNITSHLREELETSGGIFNAIIEAFRDAGLVDYNMDSEAKSTLGGGIQSITEDTANLLASYINGIRADVAAIRQAVTAQAGMTTPAPTLAEYLTQIQANTYNTAQNTADLLADLRSMMTVTDGPALRVFM